MVSQTQQVIIIGGGLSGLSAAHSVIQNGGRVTLIERNPFCGGNSTKATSGINAAQTSTQKAKGVQDSVEVFLKDTAKGANKGDETIPPNELQKVMVYDSAPAVQWLIEKFGIDLSLLGRLGGHSFPRTHRGKEKFPGMTITYALMEAFDKVEKDSNGQIAKLINKARVTKLLYDGKAVSGVEYVRDGKTFQEKGLVVIATGGYGADYSDGSLLKTFRPDLMHYATTNGDHCKGDGIKMSQALGGDVIDMEQVQVHPTGLVSPKDPHNKVKFLAAEALRGCGGIMIDANGKRFCDELGRRDYCTEQMNKNKGPFKLILNGAASKEIEWHCKHYVGRGLMKRVETGADLAKECGVSLEVLEKTFNEYNGFAQNKNDPFGKKFFANLPLKTNDFFHVAEVTPVIHYCMGGIKILPNNRVLNKKGEWIQGLWAVGETCGGVHGKNRLGGNSLLDCVVHGRVAGKDASTFFAKGQQQAQTQSQGTDRVSQVSNQVQQAKGSGSFTSEEVAKHTSEHDCWVILYGEVYNVSSFLNDHPGGKDSIMLYAGQDATEQFDMLHQRAVLDKHGKDLKLGKLLGAKL